MLDQIWNTIVLGTVQGVAEWLPVSSTGHLRLAEHYLGLSLPILLDVILHIGTLVVIFVFFRGDIKNLLLALAHLDFRSESGRLIPLILVGTLPTVLIGLAFSDLIESTFMQVLPIAAALLICGVILYSSKVARERTDAIDYRTALILGVAQGIAIIPGISRSGATIVAALLIGLKREIAFKFSFLLSIPAVLGALGLTFYRERAVLTIAGFGFAETFLGAMIAMIVGYAALNVVKRIIENKKLHLFAFYCWILGGSLFALSLMGF